MTKNLLFSALMVCLVFSGCKPTYTKDTLTDSIQKLIKKEYKLDGRAKLEGETLYLEVNLSDMVSTEQKILAEMLKKVQGASLVITRASLSSDAKIKFMVLVVSEPTFKLHLRIIQKLDDIKAFLYQKISKADYEDRLVLEIESNLPSIGAAAALENANAEIGMKEFVGRLIISQINMVSRSNPFIGVVLGNNQLKYMDFKDDELIVAITKDVSTPVMPLFQEIINTQSVKISKKYAGWGPKKIRLVGDNNQSVLIDIVPGNSIKIKN